MKNCVGAAYRAPIRADKMFHITSNIPFDIAAPDQIHIADDRLPEDDLHGHGGSSRGSRVGDSRHPPTPSHTPNSLSVPGSPRFD